MRSLSRSLAPLAGAGLLCLSLAGCGSSGGDDDQAGPSTPAASPSAAASAAALDKASGEPLLVGFINADTSPLGDYSYVTKAAQAAVSYLNDSAKGLGGRPVQLEVCATDATTAKSASCAQQLVDKKVVAVVGGLDQGADGSVPVVLKAGLPYIGAIPVNGTEFAAPGAFSFVSAVPGDLGAADLFAAQQLKAKAVGIVTVDVASAKGAADGFGAKVLQGLGVKTDVVTHGVTETDLTASYTRASKGKDAVFGIESSGGCISLMKARASTSSTLPLVLFGCSDAATLKAAGAAAEGVYFAAAQSSPTDSDADTTTWRTAMDTYAKGIELNAFSQGPMTAFVSLNKVLAGATDLSPTGISTALKAAKAVPGFMAPDFTCDGKQVPMLPALCTGGATVLQNKGGTLTAVTQGFLDVFAARG